MFELMLSQNVLSWLLCPSVFSEASWNCKDQSAFCLKDRVTCWAVSHSINPTIYSLFLSKCDCWEVYEMCSHQLDVNYLLTAVIFMSGSRRLKRSCWPALKVYDDKLKEIPVMKASQTNLHAPFFCFLQCHVFPGNAVSLQFVHMLQQRLYSASKAGMEEPNGTSSVVKRHFHGNIRSDHCIWGTICMSCSAKLCPQTLLDRPTASLSGLLVQLTVQWNILSLMQWNMSRMKIWHSWKCLNST